MLFFVFSLGACLSLADRVFGARLKLLSRVQKDPSYVRSLVKDPSRLALKKVSFKWLQKGARLKITESWAGAEKILDPRTLYKPSAGLLCRSNRFFKGTHKISTASNLPAALMIGRIPIPPVLTEIKPHVPWPGASSTAGKQKKNSKTNWCVVSHPSELGALRGKAKREEDHEK